VFELGLNGFSSGWRSNLARIMRRRRREEGGKGEGGRKVGGGMLAA